MTRRPPLLLALALALTACTPPAGGQCGPGAGTGAGAGAGQAVTYDQKVKRVEAMTRAMSVTQNAALQKSVESAAKVGQTMASGPFAQTTQAASGMVAAGGGNLVAAGGGNLVAAGGGNMVAAGGLNYTIASLVEDLDRAARRDVYALAGKAEGPEGTITWNDATGEVESITSKDAAATFAFVKKGDARTWTIQVTKSPDGTTGTLTVEIAADRWVAQAPPPSAGAPVFAEDDPLPNAGGIPFDPETGDGEGEGGLMSGNGGFGGDGLMAGNGGDGGFSGDGGFMGDDAEDEDEDEENASDEDDEDFGLMQADGQPPFKVFGGEQPDFDTVTRVRLAADFKAQGDAKLPLKLDLLLDDWAPYQGKATPSRLALGFTLATLAVDTDTKLDFAKNAFESKGGLKIQTEEADEAFRYALAIDGKAPAGKLDLTNEGARIRYGATLAKGEGGQAAVTSALYDADTGTKLADVAMSKADPQAVEIKFTNGKTLTWKPAEGMIQQPPLGGPSPEPTPKTRRSGRTAA